MIKVETPEGEPCASSARRGIAGMAAYFLNINRNKRSIALDLKRPAARAALLDWSPPPTCLSTTCGWRRRTARPRLPAVAARNPRIVYAAATGFARTAPQRDRAGLRRRDPGRGRTCRAECLVARRPRFVPMAVCDKLRPYAGLGRRHGAVQPRAHRHRPGGPCADAGDVVAFNLVDHLWHGVLAEPEKGLGYPRMLTPHRRPYPTKDGYVCLLATTDQQWRGLFAALERGGTGR